MRSNNPERRQRPPVQIQFKKRTDEEIKYALLSPIFPSDTPIEAHREYRQSLIDILSRGVPLETEDVENFHRTWDSRRESPAARQSKTIRYGIEITEIRQGNLVRPDPIIDANHTTREIFFDAVNQLVGQVERRLRGR